MENKQKEISQGPWFIDQYGHVYAASVNGEPAPVIIDARHTQATFADKSLIAAAPDLLQSLKDMENILSCMPIDRDASKLLERAREHIADACGCGEAYRQHMAGKLHHVNQYGYTD